MIPSRGSGELSCSLVTDTAVSLPCQRQTSWLSSLRRCLVRGRVAALQPAHRTRICLLSSHHHPAARASGRRGGQVHGRVRHPRSVRWSRSASTVRARYSFRESALFIPLALITASAARAARPAAGRRGGAWPVQPSSHAAAAAAGPRRGHGLLVPRSVRWSCWRRRATRAGGPAPPATARSSLTPFTSVCHLARCAPLCRLPRRPFA